MESSEAVLSFDDAARFHGHVCPGLAIGYRVAKTALELLGVDRPHDEELVAIVENDTCAVDAVQVVTGCTFGKGNLQFKDYGKGGFSFFSRDKQRGLRIRYREFPSLSDPKKARMEELRQKIHFKDSASEAERREHDELRREMIQLILTCESEKLLDWRWLEDNPPQPARIRPSIVCDSCGEAVMETRIRQVNGKSLCIPCSEQAG
jgi:formylmethanofuran dehydrogenase subunit E